MQVLEAVGSPGGKKDLDLKSPLHVKMHYILATSSWRRRHCRANPNYLGLRAVPARKGLRGLAHPM